MMDVQDVRDQQGRRPGQWAIALPEESGCEISQASVCSIRLSRRQFGTRSEANKDRQEFLREDLWGKDLKHRPPGSTISNSRTNKLPYRVWPTRSLRFLPQEGRKNIQKAVQPIGSWRS